MLTEAKIDLCVVLVYFLPVSFQLAVTIVGYENTKCCYIN